MSLVGITVFRVVFAERSCWAKVRLAGPETVRHEIKGQAMYCCAPSPTGQSEYALGEIKQEKRELKDRHCIV